MIITWLIQFVCWLVSNVLDLFPTLTFPDWATQAGSYVDSINAYLSSVSVWFPFDITSSALAFFVLVLLAALAVKLVRIVLSFATAGGGSSG